MILRISIIIFGIALLPHCSNSASVISQIYASAECPELKNLCTHLKTTDDVSVLECVAQTASISLVKSLPAKCQHILWQQKRTILLDSNWAEENVIQKVCSAESVQLQLSYCNNVVEDIWSCLKDRTSQLDPIGNSCRLYINRVTAVISDLEPYREFYSICGEQVDQNKCGRLSGTTKFYSELETLQCMHNVVNIERNCLDVMQQLAADLKFYDVCSEDLHHLCDQERFGTPSAFKCLLKNKGHPSFSHACKDQIAKRDQDIAKDYRVSHGLARACKDDIKLYHCRRGVGISEDKQVRLAQILLCLETVVKNGTRINEKCSAEIDDHRRMLMQDYQLSPEILNDCSDDIVKYCNSQGQSVHTGDIIHCLMEHVHVKRRKDRRVTAQCQRSLETLIKITDAGEDWRVDPVLRRACKPVVDVACRDTVGGEARVISCLMEHIGTQVMNTDCEQSLLLIQYFVARDFKLDPQLYKHCRDDAVKHCRAKRVWDDVNEAQMDPERGPLILPCLHRIAYSDGTQAVLRKDCFKEVKRVMRQRAISVDLIPEVEDFCIEDLSVFCAERTERGAEMECLQKNLDALQLQCKTAVTTYTEEEAAHVELNPVIMTVCADAMKTHCEHIIKSEKDSGDMMDCLISHKNDADLRQDLKCRAAIEHFQIISLKNYHFTYKFKEACRPYVMRFCGASTTKNDVVACLSEVMRNNTIRGQRHSIPKECRQQVKAQLYQQRESLVLDPKLAHACQKEMETFCADERGPGQAVECLVTNTGRLGTACHHAVFLIKKFELGDSATDFTLVNTCKEMAYKFCAKIDPMHLLDCLKNHKDDPAFDSQCHLVVVNRMIEQNTDYRFNPKLQLACGKSIDRYCSDIISKEQPNEELNGKVIQCLKTKFRESKLEPECEKQMIVILQEQALNYKLNPLLQNFCKSEIAVLCKPDVNAQEQGLVEECLKNAFLNQKIVNRDCKLEVATLIAEAKADIQVDPILEDACTVDLLRYCSNVKSGNGRKLKCLQVIMQDQSKAMEKDCRLKLQKRIEMFQNADTVLAQPPENMEQLVQQVVTSPAKKFFLVILMTAVGMIFIMGIFLGRITKRAMTIKNK